MRQRTSKCTHGSPCNYHNHSSGAKKCNVISGEMIRVRFQFLATKYPREAATTISFNTMDFWRQAFWGAARRRFSQLMRPACPPTPPHLPRSNLQQRWNDEQYAKE